MKAPNLTNIDFIAKRKLVFAIPIIIILAGLVVAIVFGFNTDLKFGGSTVIEYSYNGDIDLGEIKSTARNELGTSVRLQVSTVQSSGSSLVITAPGNNNLGDKVDTLTEKLTEEYPDNFTDTSVTTRILNSQANNQYYYRVIVVSACVLLLVFVYFAIRFRKIGGWSAGCASVITLVHNLLFVVAGYAVCRLYLDNGIIIAMLFVLGYTILNTMTFFEYIRANKTGSNKKVALNDLVNLSITKNSRGVIGITAAILLALMVLTIVGSGTLVSFSIATFIGIIASAFSSICLVGPLWTIFRNKKAKTK